VACRQSCYLALKLVHLFRQLLHLLLAELVKRLDCRQCNAFPSSLVVLGLIDHKSRDTTIDVTVDGAVRVTENVAARGLPRTRVKVRCLMRRVKVGSIERRHECIREVVIDGVNTHKDSLRPHTAVDPDVGIHFLDHEELVRWDCREIAARACAAVELPVAGYGIELSAFRYGKGNGVALVVQRIGYPVLPPGARVTVGVFAMLTFGVLPTLTVPTTLVVPWAATGTGAPVPLTTSTGDGPGPPRVDFWPNAGTLISTHPASNDATSVNFDLAFMTSLL